MLTGFQKGARYNYTNNTGSAIASSQVVVLATGSAGYIGIAITAIAVGAVGVLAIGGADERVNGPISKHAGEAFTDAQVLYWDATNQRLTGTATNNTKAGRSYGTQGSAATTAYLILNA